MPRRFFTEHDLHSYLYRLVETELSNRGELFANTADGYRTVLVHHEYPTPFRCDMSNHSFRKTEDTNDRTTKGGLYRRGHYDLAILNPEFVRQYNSVIVAGKNYGRLRLVRGEIEVTPLLWVCEIVFGAHTEDVLPVNWVGCVTQDAKKVIESLNYKLGKETKFAQHGDVAIFIGSKPNEKTRRLE